MAQSSIIHVIAIYFYIYILYITIYYIDFIDGNKKINKEDYTNRISKATC